MKLKSPEDKAFFLVDTNRLDLLESFNIMEEVPEELFETFIKLRRPLVAQLVDFEKKNLTKQQWRSSRFKFLRGIRRFNKSLESKRMHKPLGKFLSVRILRQHVPFLKERYENLDALKFDTLKSLSSYKTHAYIESEYYASLSEEVEYKSFMEYMVPLLNEIEINLYKNPDVDISDDGIELLLRICDNRELCKSFSDLLEIVPVEKIIEAYQDTQNTMMNNGSSHDETYFMTHLVENFVPCLLDIYEKITNSEK